MLMARSLFLCCERSFWQLATRFVAMCVLRTFTAGAVSIDTNVFRLDDDFNAVVDLRRNIHAGKGSMPPLGLIEGRNAHQPVNADFTLHQAEGVLAVHGECRGFQ